jgi:dolichol kinase
MGERRRRAIHLSGSLLPLSYLLGWLEWPTLQRVTLALAIGAALLEAVRLTAGRDWRLFRSLTRPYERDNVAAYALFGWSTALVAWLFAPVVAVPGMLMLSVVDPIAGVLGRRVGGGWTASPDGIEADAPNGDDEAVRTGDGSTATTAPNAGPVRSGADSDHDGDGAGDAGTGSEPGGRQGPGAEPNEGRSTPDARGTAPDERPGTGSGSGDAPPVAGRGKSVIVLVVTFLLCFGIAWPFTAGLAGPTVGGLAAALGALGATLADGVKPVVAGYVLDDNLTIPPAACLGIQSALTLAGTGVPPG